MENAPQENQNDKPKQEFTITEEDKINFFKAFLADKPYEEKFTIFDGAVTLSFRTLSTKETTGVFNQLRQAQADGELTNDPNYILTLTNYRLGLSLISINDEPFNPLPDTTEDYIKKKAELLSTWPIFKLSSIVEVFKRFEHKVVALADATVSDENFWKAVR